MFKVDRVPADLNPFFRFLESEFHWEHFQYMKIIVLLIAFSWGRRNVSALYRLLGAWYPDGQVRITPPGRKGQQKAAGREDKAKKSAPKDKPHRTRFNNFLLLTGCWLPNKVLRFKFYHLLAALNPGAGETIYLIIDDSKKHKRGKHMDAVGWIRDPLTGRSIRGHQYVTAVAECRGHTIPFGIRLYVKKEDCRSLEVAFSKTTEMAAELISQFDAPVGGRVIVLFDSYYLCPTVVKACRQKGFPFVSTLKSNRNLYRRGAKFKAGLYGLNQFRKKAKKTLKLSKSNGPVHYTYVDAGLMDVSDLGTLHVVFSRKDKERKILGVVTDDPSLSAAAMLRAYDHRWSIELFFKDTKQLLGLGQYQNVSYEAAVTHLHLVCLAYALLTHIALEREGEKGKQKDKAAPLSTAELQNELRRVVWNDLVRHLKELPDASSVIKELQRLFAA